MRTRQTHCRPSVHLSLPPGERTPPVFCGMCCVSETWQFAKNAKKPKSHATLCFAWPHVPHRPRCPRSTMTARPTARHRTHRHPSLSMRHPRTPRERMYDLHRISDGDEPNTHATTTSERSHTPHTAWSRVTQTIAHQRAMPQPRANAVSHVHDDSVDTEFEYQPQSRCSITNYYITTTRPRTRAQHAIQHALHHPTCLTRPARHQHRAWHHVRLRRQSSCSNLVPHTSLATHTRPTLTFNTQCNTPHTAHNVKRNDHEDCCVPIFQLEHDHRIQTYTYTSHPHVAHVTQRNIRC